MTKPQIYTDMRAQLMLSLSKIVFKSGGGKTSKALPSIQEGIGDKGFLLPLPESVSDYLALRKKALSDSSCRAQDTASTHLTWMTYHQHLASHCDVVDGVAWEMLYQELAETFNVSIDALNCMEMGINADPAQTFLHIRGFKPMLTPSTKTTPEYVAYANAHAEEHEWDLSQLFPPALALSFDEMNQFDEIVKEMLTDLGVEGEVPSFLDVMMGADVGDDVSLA